MLGKRSPEINRKNQAWYRSEKNSRPSQKSRYANQAKDTTDSLKDLTISEGMRPGIPRHSERTRTDIYREPEKKLFDVEVVIDLLSKQDDSEEFEEETEDDF